MVTIYAATGFLPLRENAIQMPLRLFQIVKDHLSARSKPWAPVRRASSVSAKGLPVNSPIQFNLNCVNLSLTI